MIKTENLTPELLRKVIDQLPPGWARSKYEKVLYEKTSAPQGGLSCEEEPALYFLSEILALRSRTDEDLEDIHKAKLQFPGQRLIQERAGERTSEKLSRAEKYGEAQ